ncbi:hypothetical protein OHC33_010411 [Knufia fluminis]|uniref:DNA polymerase lambda n=1 Tax=Knufia fluminis TaxID=191047 RepID=A0AAN8I3I6_9EURO|nr:hypothetical protein OHC33_010411 [Knufia fluminis]
MPSDQREKERFFAQLDTLDESTESEDDSSQLDPRKRRKVESVEEPCIARPRPEHTEARKKPDTNELAKADIPALRRAITENQPVAQDDSVPPIRRTNSEPESTRRSRKSNAAVKTIGTLFEGLTFFFIPNDDVVKVRKLRIQSAIAQGATWARKLDPAITHIIVDATIDAAGAKRVIKDTIDVTNTAIVKDTWLIESLSHKDVRNPSQGRFQLKGASTTFGKTNAIRPERALKRPEAVRNANAKIDTNRQPEHTATGAEAADELSQIMLEMKTAAHLPFDAELDLDKFVSFTGGDELAEGEPAEPSTVDEAAPVPLENRGFACMESHTGKSDNPNNRTIDILQQMATHYDRTGDKWRTLAYRKGISALRKQASLISTKEQALAVNGIGGRLADKIEEIVTTNRLARLDSVLEDPDEQVLQLFMGIYDVGYTQAKLWMHQGYRSLDDLRAHAKLSTNQQIGVDHYDDFQQRIPRAEVEAHGAVVQKALTRADRKLQAIIGGSYRRGMPNSGDIDVMITHPTADVSQLREWAFGNAVPYLFRTGFMKCALATSRGKAKDQTTPSKTKKRFTRSTTTTIDMNTDPHTSPTNLIFTGATTGTKLLGASQLPPTLENPNPPWRRIDLLLVPACSLGANLIYFTGNDIFNRSMRLLASRKGMRLNQHGLYKNVIRGPNRVKETEGELVEGRSEKKIFQILGVPWRPPEERRC